MIDPESQEMNELISTDISEDIHQQTDKKTVSESSLEMEKKS